MSTQSDQIEENDETTISGETKAERFKRIANPRLAKCQTAIRALGKCASSDYEYTPEQVDTIEKILRDELANLMRRYRTGDTNEAPQLL